MGQKSRSLALCPSLVGGLYYFARRARQVADEGKETGGVIPLFCESLCLLVYV